MSPGEVQRRSQGARGGLSRALARFLSLFALTLSDCSALPEVSPSDVNPMDGVVPLDASVRDTTTDVLRELGADTRTDRTNDAGFDVTTDIRLDVTTELRPDTTTDAYFDIATELRLDAGTDLAADLTTDVGFVCPSDMVRLPSFCMDRYEAPNVAGAAPLAMQNATTGVLWCAARGKRLCTEAEWLRACQGPRGLAYPYGTSYVRGRCTDDRTWRSPNWTTLGAWPSAAAMAEAARLYQADPSGSRGPCVSEEGVYDLTGNVAEWVARSFPHANNYDHVMKGCYWAGCYGGAAPSCGFVNPAHPSGFRSYEAGFRCCLSAP